MKRKIWVTRLICMLLIAGTIAGVAIAVGEAGSQTNPLVTLDYLNKAIEELTKSTEEKIEAKANELLGQMKSEGAAFVTVTVDGGKSLYLSAGSQVILRTGSASSPGGILDVTTGEVTAGDMQMNFLYIAVGEAHRSTVSGTATFLVLGEYSLQ